MAEGNLIDAADRFQNSNHTEARDKKELIKEIENKLDRVSHNIASIPSDRKVNLDLDENKAKITITADNFQLRKEEKEKYERELNRRLDFINSVEVTTKSEIREVDAEEDIERALTEKSPSNFPVSGNREVVAEKNHKGNLEIEIKGDFTSKDFFRAKDEYEDKILELLQNTNWVPYNIEDVSLIKEVKKDT